jgi:GR25 family glycosyltransferase involved in LPS biosynthesis
MTNRHRELEEKWNNSNRKEKKKWTKDLRPPVVIRKGTPNLIINSKREKKLDVVIVSVNYNDFLAVSLQHNVEIFDNITIVTSESDILCQKICEKFGVNCVVTNIMYEDNSEFNKGKAINYGIKSLNNPDFILLLDADIIVRGKLDLENLNENILYTSPRYICKSYNQLNEVISNGKILDDNFQFEGDKGIGFFQLFNINHQSIDKDKVYPETSTDASWDDLIFRDKFPNREVISNKVIHLGDPYVNWKGRKSNRFLNDEEITNILNKTDKKFDINKYFDKIYCLNLDRRKDRWDKVSKEFSRLSINIERFSAIDGDNIPDSHLTFLNTKLDEKSASDSGDIENKYALGCLLSHLEIIKDAKLNGYKKILVFEDDVILSKDFIQEVRIIKKFDWKLFYLGASQFSWNEIEIRDGFYKCNKTLGTFAYAVDSSIYDELIKSFLEKDKSVDNVLSRIQSKYNKNCFTIYPNIVISNVENSDIREEKNISAYAESMRWNLDMFDRKIRVLLVPDVENWAFDNIAKSIVKYNPYSDLIEYEILYATNLYNETKINYENYDLIYVFFEAERMVEDSYKIIRGCYSSFWEEDRRFSPEVISSYFSKCRASVFANSYLKQKISKHLPKDFPTLILPDSSDDELFYPIEGIRKKEFTAIFVGNTKRKVKKFDDIKDICEKSGVKLIVCENIKNSELVNYYNQADICINFSLSEGGPQTFIESALCEVPMLIRKDNELSKIIPCFTGESKEEFIDILNNLKRNRKLCKKRGKEARKVALEGFTYRKTSQSFGKFVLELSGSKINQSDKFLDDLTVFVISFGENPNYLDCKNSLENQTVKFHIKEIKDISPMSKAFQKMIDNCKTKYYIQVDEDMILHSDAIEKIYNSLISSEENISTVAHMLRDVHLDFNLYGIKAYKHEVLKKYPYNLKIISCEVEQINRLQSDGYETIMVEEVVGYHSPKWTPELIFERYFDLMEKWKKFNYHWMSELPSKLMHIYQNDPSELNLYAMMGAMCSISSDEPIRDREKNFSIKDKNFQKIKKMIEVKNFNHIINRESKSSSVLNKDQMFGK